MKKLITPYNAVIAAFIAAEVVIYAIFNALAAVGAPDPINLKYSGVLLCLAVAVVCAFFNGKDGIALAAALAFTAISDLFILVLDSYYEVGVTTFIVVQCIYMYRLNVGRAKKAAVSACVRVAIALALIIMFAVLGYLDYLLAVVCIYIVMLLVNMAEAVMLCRGGLHNALFAAGLVLFFCCDICVGLNNFDSVLGVALPAGLLDFVGIAMWAFYLPSQVLIVCSARKGGISAGKESNEKAV